LAGIYLHIPYCKTLCNYCDFFSTTNDSSAGKFVDTLCRELELRKNELPNETIQTIYFGGGTPSQLTIAQFRQIFDTIAAHYRIDSEAEITIEANPDDLNEEYIKGLTTLPFNRISIGIQSFDDDDLKRLRRRHSSTQALDAIELCRKHGLTNISIDLMYGLPDQTIEAWSKNVTIACNLAVQHISAYHLIYEKGTALYRKLKKGEVVEADEELSILMFRDLRDQLAKKGFQHYEISNFALNGYVSRHNSSYWSGIPYLGIGAAAHSFNGIDRLWNAPNLTAYIAQGETGLFLPEIEKSTLHSRYNDFIIITLRTMWGLNLSDLTQKFGDELSNYFLKEVTPFIKKGWVIKSDNNYRIAIEGLFVSNTILSELLFVD
jgi:oxygen-independent coproporphyrinogen-3 oxidase